MYLGFWSWGCCDDLSLPKYKVRPKAFTPAAYTIHLKTQALDQGKHFTNPEGHKGLQD